VSSRQHGNASGAQCLQKAGATSPLDGDWRISSCTILAHDVAPLWTATIGRIAPAPGREVGKVWNRRILPVRACSGGGRLIERTPAVQPRRQERVKVPQSRHPFLIRGTSGWHLDSTEPRGSFQSGETAGIVKGFRMPAGHRREGCTEAGVRNRALRCCGAVNRGLRSPFTRAYARFAVARASQRGNPGCETAWKLVNVG